MKKIGYIYVDILPTSKNCEEKNYNTPEFKSRHTYVVYDDGTRELLENLNEEDK